jgi:hypothetical protein
MAEMKMPIALLAVVLAAVGCSERFMSSDARNTLGYSPPPPDVDEDIKANQTGVGKDSIRAEVGKFILLKRRGSDVALKIVENTRPRRDSVGVMLGAKYQCFVFDNDDRSHFKQYAGEVYMPDGEGVADHADIDCGTFRVLWGPGNWIAYYDSISAIARTDTVDIKDVNFADPKLEWHYARSDNQTRNQGNK